jgi:hypothetical protein
MSTLDHRSSLATGPQVLRLKTGEDRALEDIAAALLAKGREGVTALCDKRDYLTADQLALRAAREVSNATGVCDEALMRGLFRRAFNPLSGHRPRGHLHSDD